MVLESELTLLLHAKHLLIVESPGGAKHASDDEVVEGRSRLKILRRLTYGIGGAAASRCSLSYSPA